MLASRKALSDRARSGPGQLQVLISIEAFRRLALSNVSFIQGFAMIFIIVCCQSLQEPLKRHAQSATCRALNIASDKSNLR